MKNSRLVALVLVVLGMSLGCASRGKTTPDHTPDLAVETREVTPVLRGTESTPTADVVEPDPWSGDLGELNDYIARNGLLGTVYFDFDRSELRTDASQQLEKNARFLRQHPELVVRIEGHCDERGTAEYNISLGHQRAYSTMRYLASLGVGSERLQIVSYGKERPVCEASDESCWWQNRRAAFVVTSKRGSSAT